MALWTKLKSTGRKHVGQSHHQNQTCLWLQPNVAEQGRCSLTWLVFRHSVRLPTVLRLDGCSLTEVNYTLFNHPQTMSNVQAEQVLTLLKSITHRLIDWLMIAYIALFSVHLSRLTALACGSTWVTSFSYHVFWISTEVVYLSTGMASATWNCCHLGASSVYTIQPCTMSLHAKPHT